MKYGALTGLLVSSVVLGTLGVLGSAGRADPSAVVCGCPGCQTVATLTRGVGAEPRGCLRLREGPGRGCHRRAETVPGPGVRILPLLLSGFLPTLWSACTLLCISYPVRATAMHLG